MGKNRKKQPFGKYYSLDRIEGDIAVLTDDEGRVINVRADSLPEAESGRVYVSEDGDFVPDRREEEERRSKNLSLLEKLKMKSKQRCDDEF
jgi:hypothetical protein